MKEITRHLPTQGVVLRYTNFREADRMITLLSPELGKISVLARGCRKQKSRFLSATELFAYGDYVLYRKGDFHIMTQANVRDSFYEIRNDFNKLVYSSYILDLTDEVASPGQEDYHLFYLLLQILSYLCYSDLCPKDITHVFEVKLMAHLGYRPVLDSCMNCGSNSKSYHFDVREGGLICDDCHNMVKRGYTIQMGTIRTIEHILDMDIKRLNILKIPAPIKEELDRILEAYVEERLEKRLKTRQFMKKISRERGPS
ncbi:MAG: DNA repair protein RecO [Clostridiales bacterium]|nr:DNA repair protein RecO [Clostridiales bacterium]